LNAFEEVCHDFPVVFYFATGSGPFIVAPFPSSLSPLPVGEWQEKDYQGKCPDLSYVLYQESKRSSNALTGHDHDGP
jgi:hypothetical protein